MDRAVGIPGLAKASLPGSGGTGGRGVRGELVLPGWVVPALGGAARRSVWAACTRLALGGGGFDFPPLVTRVQALSGPGRKGCHTSRVWAHSVGLNLPLPLTKTLLNSLASFWDRTFIEWPPASQVALFPNC